MATLGALFPGATTAAAAATTGPVGDPVSRGGGFGDTAAVPAPGAAAHGAGVGVGLGLVLTAAGGVRRAESSGAAAAAGVKPWARVVAARGGGCRVAVHPSEGDEWGARKVRAWVCDAVAFISSISAGWTEKGGGGGGVYRKCGAKTTE